MGLQGAAPGQMQAGAAAMGQSASPLGDVQSGVSEKAVDLGTTPRITDSDSATAATSEKDEQDTLKMAGAAGARERAAAPNEFQKFVAEATGTLLPIHGSEFFSANNGYKPSKSVPVPGDYVLGPGDELLVRGWGAVDIEFRAVIDRDGLINIPKVGTVALAGVRAGNVEAVLRAAIGKVYRGFTLSVTHGQLRGITIYVVGQARRPGTYTVSSLSTLLTALFESGGPSPNGSLRHVQVKRAGVLVGEMDLYALLAKGDKSSDVKLADGDVIVIPPAGGYVALTGMVERSAIFELRGEDDTVENLLEMAGGLPVVADPRRLIIEHLDPGVNQPRTVEDLTLDAAGLKKTLKSGDMVSVLPISPEFANAVTLRVRNGLAFRMPFVPGMKVTDMIPDKASLLSRAAFIRQNSFGRGLADQYEEFNWGYAVVERPNRGSLMVDLVGFNLERALADPSGPDNISLQVGDTVTVFYENDVADLPVPPALANAVTVRTKNGRSFRAAFRPGMKITDLIPEKASLLTRADIARQSSVGRGLGEQYDKFNWDYAVVERPNRADLTVSLVAFSLEGALANPKGPDNILLQVGDTVTVFSSDDVRIPIAKRRVFVRIEGEVKLPGVYLAKPGESLINLVLNAGGMTPDAYLFGAEFYREAVRRSQQENLDKLVRRYEQQSLSETNRIAANNPDAQAQAPVLAAQAESRQRFLQGLRLLKSTGRMSLGIDSAEDSLAQLPDIRLENGDRLVVPNRPDFVQVAGAVEVEAALVWFPGRTVSDYLAQAGASQDADKDAMFVVRANGAVLSNSSRWLSSVSGLDVMPGDVIVIPEKLDKETAWRAFTRNAKDITQILYQFGIGAAAWKTLK